MANFIYRIAAGGLEGAGMNGLAYGPPTFTRIVGNAAAFAPVPGRQQDLAVGVDKYFVSNGDNLYGGELRGLQPVEDPVLIDAGNWEGQLAIDLETGYLYLLKPSGTLHGGKMDGLNTPDLKEIAAGFRGWTFAVFNRTVYFARPTVGAGFARLNDPTNLDQVRDLGGGSGVAVGPLAVQSDVLYTFVGTALNGARLDPSGHQLLAPLAAVGGAPPPPLGPWVFGVA
jgi:hypothetical protein